MASGGNSIVDVPEAEYGLLTSDITIYDARTRTDAKEFTILSMIGSRIQPITSTSIFLRRSRA